MFPEKNRSFWKHLRKIRVGKRIIKWSSAKCREGIPAIKCPGQKVCTYQTSVNQENYCNHTQARATKYFFKWYTSGKWFRPMLRDLGMGWGQFWMSSILFWRIWHFSKTMPKKWNKIKHMGSAFVVCFLSLWDPMFWLCFCMLCVCVCVFVCVRVVKRWEHAR